MWKPLPAKSGSWLCGYSFLNSLARAPSRAQFEGGESHSEREREGILHAFTEVHREIGPPQGQESGAVALGRQGADQIQRGRERALFG